MKARDQLIELCGEIVGETLPDAAGVETPQQFAECLVALLSVALARLHLLAGADMARSVVKDIGAGIDEGEQIIRRGGAEVH